MLARRLEARGRVKTVVRKKSASSQAVLFYLVNLIAIAILEGRVPCATTAMAEHKLTADQRTAIAVRMSGRTGADGFPELSSWEAADSLRFQADWQGKNVDPERETEVRLLWTRETLYLRFREKHELKSELRRRVTLNEANKTWIAELALPMKSLVERFDPAASWRVNFFRVEGASEPRFYSAWQPTGTPAPNFHVPEAFGTLIFAEGAAVK